MSANLSSLANFGTSGSRSVQIASQLRAPSTQYYCPLCDAQVFTYITNVKTNHGNKTTVRCCLNCSEIIGTVPAPRLVCIETNPGPSQSIEIKENKNNNNKSYRKKGRKTHKKTGRLLNTLFAPSAQGLPRSMAYVPDNQVYKFTASQVVTAVLTTSTTVATFQQRMFQLSYLDQATSFESVFDQYKIEFIEYVLMPRLTTQDGSQLSNTGLVGTSIDYDDANALSTFASILDYSNCLVGAGTQAHYRCFKPHYATAVYSGSFTSYGNSTGWIDCGSATVQHYGVKIAAEPTSSALIYDEIVRYHLSFRNVR
jgi:hypothetical protein